MKRLMTISIIGILLLSGLAALNATATTTQPITTGQRTDYTHTVLVEVGTATWCPSCPESNAAWHTIYETHNYNFQYTEIIYDKTPIGQQHLIQDYNIYWVPTSYFDGGQNTYPGTSIPTFENYLDTSGTRPVPDLYGSLNVVWLGNDQLSITSSVKNNDSTDYAGTLRVYVVEKVSHLWKDYSNNWYNHAFLDFVINENLTITAGSTFTNQTIWTSPYPGISQDNIQVILAMFGDEWHQGYSDPFYQGTTDGAPFSAYYVDETVMAEPGASGAPLPPSIPTGPTSGYTSTLYNYTTSTINPSGNPLYYLFDWGDGTDSGWIGPYASGTPVTASHAWTLGGTYNVKVKAKEVQESNWSQPLAVTITGSNLRIDDVKGGLFQVKAKINNTGSDVLNDVHFRITLHSGVWSGKLTNGTIVSIPAYGNVTVKSGFVTGLGTTNIKIEAWIDGGATTTVTKTGKIFLFYIKID